MGQLVAEMREAIIELAGNRALFDTRERWLERAARVAGISSRMAKSFFYCERVNPSAEVVDRIRNARDHLRAKKREYSDVQGARMEYGDLLKRIEKLEKTLRVRD